jgi:hypothetical protein
MNAKLRTNLAAAFIYYGFRIYGATKAHAWARTKVVIAEAFIDKVVEMSHIRHPDARYAGKLQATFEGGPINGSVRHVDEPCDTITVEELSFRYRRTNRTRGESVIFVPLEPAAQGGEP